MNVALWVLQSLLALAFLAHGWLFLFPPADMVELMNASIQPAFRMFLGVAEVLAAVGLTLPGITRILPWLVSCAAAGLMIVMIGATILHTTRGELSSAITTAILFAVLTFVAYMRWTVKPILPRTVPYYSVGDDRQIERAEAITVSRSGPSSIASRTERARRHR